MNRTICGQFMSKVIYKNNDLEIRSWDILKLVNGKYAGVFGAVYEHVSTTDLPFDDERPIYMMTNPFSSITSVCYPEHVVEIVEHCGCFENQMDWWHKNNINQELYIRLDKGQKE